MRGRVRGREGAAWARREETLVAGSVKPHLYMYSGTSSSQCVKPGWVIGWWPYFISFLISSFATCTFAFAPTTPTRLACATGGRQAGMWLVGHCTRPREGEARNGRREDPGGA